MVTETKGEQVKNAKVAKTLNKNSKIYKVILKALEDKKAEKISVLDLRKITQATSDFFVVCEAETSVQLRAIAEEVEKVARENCDERPYLVEGLNTLQWIIIDYVDIVVHIMLPDTRKFYNLEGMWGDFSEEE